MPEVMIIDRRCRHLPKLAKINGDYSSEVLTFAKSNGHFTGCFEGQVHQVLYLCCRETWGRRGTPGNGQSFLISLELEPYMAAYLGNKINLLFGAFFLHWKATGRGYKEWFLDVGRATWKFVIC